MKRIPANKKILVSDLAQNRLLRMGWPNEYDNVQRAIKFVNGGKTKEAFKAEIFRLKDFKKGLDEAEDVWETIAQVCKDIAEDERLKKESQENGTLPVGA